MTSREALAKLYALQTILLPSSMVRPRLTAWVAFRLARLFTEFGPDPNSAASLVSVMVYHASRGNDAEAEAWVAAMRSLCMQANTPGAAAYVEFYALMHVESMHLHPLAALERLEKVQGMLFDCGDYGVAALAVFTRGYLAMPFSVGLCSKILQEARSFIPIKANPALVRELECFESSVRIYQGSKLTAAERELLESPERDASQPLLARATRMNVASFYMSTGNMAAARDIVFRLPPPNDATSTPLTILMEAFHAILICTQSIAEQGETPQLQQTMAVHMPRLRRAARKGASRWKCYLTLVEAERAGLRSEHGKAARLYEEACDQARMSSAIAAHATGLELAARFHLRRGHRLIGVELLRRSAAMHEARGLEVHNEELLREAAALAGEAPEPTRETPQERFDDASETIQTLIDLNQRLSGVHHLDTILLRVGESLARWVGDGRVLLLIYGDGPARVVGDTAGAPQDVPLFLTRDAPPTTLWTVSNVAAESRVRTDPYFAGWRAGVCLLMPILLRGHVRAGIYCDNRDALALSKALIKNVELIAGQTAIAFESAAAFHKLDAEVERRTRDFRAAQAELDRLQLDDAEIQMASGFAHEIRTAVASARFALAAAVRLEEAGIVSAQEEIQEHLARAIAALDANDIAALQEQRAAVLELLDYFETLLRNTREGLDRAVGVTRQVLEYAEAGQLVVGDHRVAIDSMLEELIGGVSADLAEHGVELRVQGHVGVDLPMREEHAFAVMRNLLANARDAVCNKPNAQLKRIVVTVQPQPNEIRVQVEDTGTGMTPAAQEHIFQPFFSTKGARGTGLGLGLSRKLVRLYGGDLQFTSREGQGTTFAFTVPRVGS